MSDPIFVLGVPRSGTTLLRVMLAGNPALFSPPEMVIAPFSTMQERKEALEVRFWEKGGLRRTLMDLCDLALESARSLEASLNDKTIPEVYAWLQERIQDRILVDKCPHLAADPAALQRLNRWFPNARYLWIIRHPGSVIRSLQNMPMAEVMLQGYGGSHEQIWVEGNRNFQKFLEQIPEDRKIRLHYEDLVKDPRPGMEAFCERFKLPFHTGMLNPYEGEKMREGPSGARAVGDPNMAGRGRIEPELAESWLEGFDVGAMSMEARALALELGYDLSRLGPPKSQQVQEAMDAFFDSLKGIQRGISLPQDLDVVEGHRFLLRVAAGAVDTFVEWGDADHPHFEHSESPIRKTFGDCPDADYLRAPVRLSPGRSYRITGKVPEGTTYVGMLIYTRGGGIGSRLRDTNFVREDGSFEVVVSGEKPESGVWLQAGEDAQSVMVRQYFENRKRQKPLEISIVLEGAAPPPPVLTFEGLAKGLIRARRMVEATFKRTLEANKLATAMALNRFITMDAETLFPTPDNRYRICWYRFGRDQLMLVRGKVPDARYFAFTLYNAWLESLDYQHRLVHRNRTQLHLEEDGSFELCLAHRDPGHPNWLDTAGHLAGYLVARGLLQGEGEDGELVIRVMYEKEYRRGAESAKSAE
jgi:hypothetical protein